MTAADVTYDYNQTKLEEENVVITVSDGETYTARRLSSPLIAQATWAEDMGTTSYQLDVVLSSRTATFHCTGVTDKKAFVTLKGYL